MTTDEALRFLRSADPQVRPAQEYALQEWQAGRTALGVPGKAIMRVLRDGAIQRLSAILNADSKRVAATVIAADLEDLIETGSLPVDMPPAYLHMLQQLADLAASGLSEATIRRVAQN